MEEVQRRIDGASALVERRPIEGMGSAPRKLSESELKKQDTRSNQYESC